MRQPLLTLVFAIVAVMEAWAQQVPQVINVMNRQIQSLGGDWHYIVDVQEEGERKKAWYVLKDWYGSK